jgi:hypothetical protein
MDFSAGTGRRAVGGWLVAVALGVPVGAAAQSPPQACPIENENLEPILDGNQRHLLGFRTPKIEETQSAGNALSSWFSFGLVAGRSVVTARVSEARAERRIRSRLPVFPELVTPQGQRPDETFALVKFTVDGSSRVLVLGEATDSLFGGFQAEARLRENQQVPLRLERTVEGCLIQGQRATMYRGTPARPLEPGEYAVFYGDQFYDFGIDP